jgi:hypothetical protein
MSRFFSDGRIADVVILGVYGCAAIGLAILWQLWQVQCEIRKRSERRG